MINRGGARRKITGVVAIGIALACSGLDIWRQRPAGQGAQGAWHVSLVSSAYAEEEYVAVIVRVIQGVMDSAATKSSEAIQPGSSGSSGHLGMYVPSDFADQRGSSQGWAPFGGGFDLSSSGYVVKDSIVGTTKTPSVKDTLGHGGIYGVYDASRFLPANQSLTFFGAVDFARDNVTLGPGSLLPFLPPVPVSAGSAQIDLYTIAGSARWSIDNVYLEGTGIAIFGNGTEFNTFDSGVGSPSGTAYSVDAKLGDVFTLIDTRNVTASAVLPTKAPPRTTTNGYMVGLDLSGHISYTDVSLKGFTDSAGLSVGNAESNFATLGAAAELFVQIPHDNFQWKPYVLGAVDNSPRLSVNMTVPSQPALPSGDFLTFLPAPTYWTGELGLDLQNDAGWRIGVNGFYMASSDTIVRGAGAYVKIPFNFAPLVATRY